MDMVTIAPDRWLIASAAASYQRMRAAGMPAGGITDAGRTRAEQEDLWARYLAGLLQATAAEPGTSTHETGRALDVSTTSPAQAWLIANAGAHGWHRPLLHAKKPEPWHWEHVAALDQHATDAITAPTIKEIIMAGAQLSDFVGLIRCKTGAVVAVHKTTGKVRPVTHGAFETIVNAGLVGQLYLDDGAGNDLENMDEGPFRALVDLLSN